MVDTEPAEVINEIISSSGKKCARELKYSGLSSEEINQRIDVFHNQFGKNPTYEQIKEFNDQNGGVTCKLFTEAACDLLRSNGITADRVTVLDPKSSRGGFDNHALVYAADRIWLEPQSGMIIDGNDWDTFSRHYAKILGVDAAKIVAYSTRDHRTWVGSDYQLVQA